MNATTTIAAKDAFKRMAVSNNIQMYHYHYDHGLFDTDALKLSIYTSEQTIYFCGVNVHHQNGKHERYIGEITTCTCISLIYTSHQGHATTHASIWPQVKKQYKNYATT